MLCDGLPLRLVLDLPEHVADEDGPPEAAVVVLPREVQLVQGEVEHAGARGAVAGAAAALQAVGVVADGPGRRRRRGGGDPEGRRDRRATVHLWMKGACALV